MGVVKSYKLPELSNGVRVYPVTLEHTAAGIKIVTETYPAHNFEPKSSKHWNVETMKFTKVNYILNSPNYWGVDTEDVNNLKYGQLHTMFALDNCVNDVPTRGFFNNFLRPEIAKHKNAFEALGKSLDVEKVDRNQLSGISLGTVGDSLVMRVNGGKLYKVMFT